MQKWEYMFVQVFEGRITAIGSVKYKKDQFNWESWLRDRGFEGWELASEVSFSKTSIHATLKRPIQQ
jgi:hypothetical protein